MYDHGAGREDGENKCQDSEAENAASFLYSNLAREPFTYYREHITKSYVVRTESTIK